MTASEPHAPARTEADAKQARKDSDKFGKQVRMMGEAAMMMFMSHIMSNPHLAMNQMALDPDG